MRVISLNGAYISSTDSLDTTNTRKAQRADTKSLPGWNENKITTVRRYISTDEYASLLYSSTAFPPLDGQKIHMKCVPLEFTKQTLLNSDSDWAVGWQGCACPNTLPPDGRIDRMAVKMLRIVSHNPQAPLNPAPTYTRSPRWLACTLLRVGWLSFKGHFTLRHTAAVDGGTKNLRYDRAPQPQPPPANKKKLKKTSTGCYRLHTPQGKKIRPADGDKILIFAPNLKQNAQRSNHRSETGESMAQGVAQTQPLPMPPPPVMHAWATIILQSDAPYWRFRCGSLHGISIPFVLSNEKRHHKTDISPYLLLAGFSPPFHNQLYKKSKQNGDP